MAILEICCADIESVNAAVRGGADRIELCSSLETGGLTPSPGLTEGTLWKVNLMDNPVPVNILVRPRAGDFFYSDRELGVCVQDAAWATGAGASGIVFGALTPEGDVDEDACRRIIDAVEKSATGRHHPSLTFHRAFDYCRDPFEALDTIIRLGFDRILTSGLSSTALEGAELIARLCKKSAGRIIIMPGGGVTVANIAGIMRLTGATEIHASAKTFISSKMKFRRNDIPLGPDDSNPWVMPVTSRKTVEELKKALEKDNTN